MATTVSLEQSDHAVFNDVIDALLFGQSVLRIHKRRNRLVIPADPSLGPNKWINADDAYMRYDTGEHIIFEQLTGVGMQVEIVNRTPDFVAGMLLHQGTWPLNGEPGPEDDTGVTILVPPDPVFS